MTPPGVVFLMYHELEVPGRTISQNEAGYVRYIVSEASFRAQMNWLAQNGWRGLSTSAALLYPAGKTVAITFDDGCETDVITAAPILKECGFNATFYVTTGFLGKPGYLTPPQLQQLGGLGFEIGCHSMTHAYLDDLDQRGLQREIADAGKRLEDITGHKVAHFSCPGGRLNDRAISVAREAGYQSLATSRARVNNRTTDPYSLGRVAIMRNGFEKTFGDICEGKDLWRMRLGESLRSTAQQVMGNALYDRLRALLLR